MLPALFPEDPALDYHSLEGVHNGGEAFATFAKMASMGPEELFNQGTVLRLTAQSENRPPIEPSLAARVSGINQRTAP